MAAVLAKENLLGLAAGRRLPVKRAVDDLAHLAEPPVGAVQAAFTLCQPGAAIRARQSQFHLLLIHHRLTFRSMAQS